jgi:hypothetical protein
LSRRLETFIYLFRFFVSMPITYLDTIDHLYGNREFSSRDFSSRVGNPRAGKLLSDLKRRGYVARTGRGRYRRLEASERPDLRLFEWRRVRDTLLKGPTSKAWAGASAVELWTGGRYRTSPSAFVRFFTLAVPRPSIPAWRKYLRAHGLSLDSRKRIGPRVELIAVDDLKVTFLSGEPVLPRTAVVDFIRAHPGIFANAEELVLDRPR